MPGDTMSAYEPIEQKVEGEFEGDKLLSPEASKDIDLSDNRPDEAEWEQKRRRLRPCTVFEIGLLLLIVVSNLLWFVSTQTSRVQPAPKEPDYFGKPDKSMISFDHDWLDIEDNNISRYADEKWKGVFPTHGSSVALTEEFVKQHSLPPSVRAVDQPEKFIYQIAGYHQLHCLYEIRKQLYDPSALSTMEDKLRRDHILHCVEAVRQALYCFLDPTLINLEEKWPHVPNGQKHVCRNREALREWTEKHGHVLPPN